MLNSGVPPSLIAQFANRDGHQHQDGRLADQHKRAADTSTYGSRHLQRCGQREGNMLRLAPS